MGTVEIDIGWKEISITIVVDHRHMILVSQILWTLLLGLKSTACIEGIN